MPLTVEERFWTKVDKDGPLILGTPCWLWTGAKSGSGHGQFWSGSRRTSPYRWLYEREHGPIPRDLEPDHLCNNPPCVRIWRS